MPGRAANLLLLGANGSHVRSIGALRAAGFVVTAVDDLPVALGLQAADHGVRVSPSRAEPVLAALEGFPEPDGVLFTNEEAFRASLIPRTSGAHDRLVVVTADNLVDDVHGASLGLLKDSTHVQANYPLDSDQDSKRQENQGYKTGPAG